MQKRQGLLQSGRVELRAAPIRAAKLCYSLNLQRALACCKSRGTDMEDAEFDRGYNDSAQIVEEIMAEIRSRCSGESDDYCQGLKEGVMENLSL